MHPVLCTLPGLHLGQLLLIKVAGGPAGNRAGIHPGNFRLLVPVLVAFRVSKVRR